MSNIENKEISTYLDEAMMEFSAYVILHRAIPCLTDGLKVSYRRILYTMLKNKMIGGLTKSANVEGRVMEIHPHSGSYPTMVNMIRKDNNNVPWIIGKGSFGQHTSRDIQPAHQRYTECKLAPYAIDMMGNLKKNIVDMKPTFDGVSVEPIELPVKHPQVLTISQQGLAVGMASNIPSFNLTEVCQATIDYILTGNIPTLIPDLATGGYIINNPEQFTLINESGKGIFKIRSKYEIEGQYILIKEVPYTSTREDIIEKIIVLVKSGKLKDVIDIKDTTDKKGMEVEIKTKKGCDIKSVIDKLYAMTPLESSFPVNMTILDNNHPITLGVKQIIPKWVEWRRNCIKRLLTYEIQEKKEKLHLLRGLEKCLLDIDKVIDIVRNCKDEIVISQLCKNFNIDEVQAEEVASMKLRDINKDKIIKRISEINDFELGITENQKTLESTDALNRLIIDGLSETMQQYGHNRRSIVIDMCDSNDKDVLVEDYNCTVVFTHDYVKKNIRYLDKQRMKEGDSLLTTIQCNNKDKLLAFTNKGQVFTINANDIQQCMPSDLGQFQSTIFNLQNEHIVNVVKYEEGKAITLITQEGKCLVLERSLLLGRKKQAISLGKKFENNKVIYADEYSGSITIEDNKNTKQYEVGYDYYSGKPNNGGNFILNCRNGKKTIINVRKDILN